MDLTASQPDWDLTAYFTALGADAVEGVGQRDHVVPRGAFVGRFGDQAGHAELPRRVGRGTREHTDFNAGHLSAGQDFTRELDAARYPAMK